MLYVLGRGSANVVAYNLGKPWTLNSGVLKNEFNLRKEVGKRGQGTVPHGLFFRKDDGAKMYVWNRTEIFEYDLMTPWDVSTAVPSGYFAFASPVKRGHDIDIKPDGTVLYIDDRGAGKVFQYNLETPWSVESAVYDHELDLTKLHRAMRGIQFSDTGERMFILDTSLKCIFEFRLSEAWMVRSATLAKTLLIDDHFKNPRGMTWRPDGKAFYVTETADSSIHTYVVP
ncbi:MAG: hypothetical protein GX811_09415 [Lentisphaerae bacterium]|nr:hypothetical protein [Lentisphaerota bacterium]